jgi:colanic acid/amylovoran biosynthesis protein
MNILLLNTHSVLNTGDAGIVLAQVQWCRKVFSHPEIGLTSRTPDLDRLFYGPMGIHVHSPFISPPSLFAGKGQKLMACLKDLITLKPKGRLARAIKESDLVISSGGGYFYSNRSVFPGPIFFQNWLPLAATVRWEKPVFFFPQSFGPFYNSVAPVMLRRILENRNVKKIFAREDVSLHLLQGLLRQKDQGKLDICPDMAFSLEMREEGVGPPARLNLPRPIVALTVREWDFPGRSHPEKRQLRENYLQALEKACETIYRNWKGSIVIFPQARGPGIFENDRIISMKLWEKVRTSVPEGHLAVVDLPDLLPPSSIVNLLAQVDLLIATRFHSAIFAALARTPFISIGYQAKSLGTLKNLGLETFSIDISEISPDRIMALTEPLLKDCEAYRDRIARAVSETRSRIYKKLEGCFEALGYLDSL